jgi:hypothetical protein
VLVLDDADKKFPEPGAVTASNWLLIIEYCLLTIAKNGGCGAVPNNPVYALTKVVKAALSAVHAQAGQ